MVEKTNALLAVSTQTNHHVIEVSEGCLSIGETRFPDSSVSLSSEETEAVLNLLLVWKFGLEVEAVCSNLEQCQ